MKQDRHKLSNLEESAEAPARTVPGRSPAPPDDSQERSATARFQAIIQAAWRRRFLIVVPILVLLPISISAAKLLPTTFVARTLLLLQEPENNNNGFPESGQERLAGFEALLKSDQVLFEVANDLGYRHSTSKEWALAIGNLRRSLSIEILGRHFLEIQMKGNQPIGLGNQLHYVTSHFLEALIGDQNEITAGQFLIRTRQDELAEATKRMSELEARLAAVVPGGVDNANTALEELQKKLLGANQELAKLTTEIERLKQPEVTGAGTAGTTSAAPSSNSSEPTTQQAPPSPALLGKEQEKLRLTNVIAQLEQSRTQIDQSVQDHAKMRKDLKTTQEKAADAKARLDYLVQRYGTMGGRGANILSAPSLIKVVDPPKDPEFPTFSRMLYALSGLAGSIMLGIGLAWVAEWTDTRMRQPREFEELTGFPVVAHLPRIAARAQARSYPRTVMFSAIVLFAALVVLAALLAARFGVTNFPIQDWMNMVTERLTTTFAWITGLLGMSAPIN